MNIERGVSLWRKLKEEESGAVAVEAGAYFVIFFLLCALLSDLSVVFLDKGRLERVNLSMATILQQRTRFYDGNETLSANDVQQLYNLAGVLFKDSRLAGREYALYADAAYFSPGTTLKSSGTASFQAGSRNCRVRKYAMTSSEVTSLAVWHTDDVRWLPIYQVTLCIVGTQSLFKRLGGVLGMTIDDLSVSNAVLPR